MVQKEAESNGGEIDSLTIHRLFEDRYLKVHADWSLRSYDLHRDEDGVRAEVVVGSEAAPVTFEGRGLGAVEAVSDGLAKRFGVNVAVEAYDEFALGEGTNANALACIRLTANGQHCSAAALAEDTTSATLQALFSAVAQAVGTEMPAAQGAEAAETA